MAIRNNNLTFLTPDKRPLPDTTTKGFSTTTAKPVFKNLRTPESSQSQRSQINERVQDNENRYNDKLNWFQTRATELREYLNECPKIEKRKIRQIFNWEQKVGQEQSEERKLLKELGSKVRGLIKQNNQLKHTIYNGQITDLRIENQRLKFLLENIHKGEASRNKIIIEENELMQNYIERRNFKKLEEKIQQNSSLHLQNHQNIEEQNAIEELKQPEEMDEKKQPLFNATPLSIERLKNLKQYFTMYVNTAIEQNDQKFNYQQKYIDSLEKRIVQLQSINQKLEHLTFQKRVKLQQSQRKARNYTAKAPKINGDHSQDEKINSQSEERQPEEMRRPQVVLPVNYYRKKQRTTQNVQVQQGLEQQVERLRSENRILKYDLQNLRQKYEVEIEKHIRDISEKQKLQGEIQKLTFEKKQWGSAKQSKGSQ